MLVSKNLCTGCAACFSVCPKKAIKMEADKTGFLYPVIDENLCISCGMCDKTCPVLVPNKMDEFDSSVYVFQHSDEKIRKESTSGGAFTGIAEEIINMGGVVFGASFDENFVVRHTYTETTEELSQFRNSKYVQSEIRDTFAKAKEFLDNKRPVLYSGTPCQIQGFKKFLGKDYDNLILVDLICLAVPSPKIFKKYLQLKKESVPNIKKVTFRNKDLGYSYPTMLIEGDKKYRSGSESDEWLRLFLKKYSVRQSCNSCTAQDVRCSDFTIYDCNNVYEKYPQIDDEKGTSNILINTKKGAEFFEKFSSKHLVIKDETPLKSHKRKPIEINFDYDKFYEDSDTLSPKDFFAKYASWSLKIKVKKYGRIISYKLGFYKKLRSVIRSLRK